MAGAAQEKAESSRTPCGAPALVPSTPRSLKLPQSTEQHPWETRTHRSEGSSEQVGREGGTAGASPSCACCSPSPRAPVALRARPCSCARGW